MGRSVGVVVAGWVSGFLVAVAWGATRANNPRLASTLSGWAMAGMVITGLLLISIALSDRSKRRRAARSERGAPAPVSTTVEVAVATVTEQRAAARIAALEARLAREQEELDAAAASLAAAELVTSGHAGAGAVAAGSAAAELEPALRQEVVEKVAQLVGRTADAHSAVLAGEVEALLDKVR